MPGPDITRPKNNCALYAFLSLAIWVGVLVVALPAPARARLETLQAQSDPTQSSAAAAPAGSSPEAERAPKQSPATAEPGFSSQGSASQGSASQGSANRGSENQDNGTFVIRKDVDEVLLHATVVDDKQHIVTNLNQNDFTVFEDGKPQTIISFHHEDIPVAMGIVIDNSGSMREKRAKVNQAALNLVRSSNPQDEVFVVNFNDEYYLDQDFTNDLLKLKEASGKN